MCNCETDTLTAKEAVLLIAEDEGWDTDDRDCLVYDVMLKAMDSVMPGVCMKRDCAAITSRCEPDATDNWCHECGDNTVKSLGVLCFEEYI